MMLWWLWACSGTPPSMTEEEQSTYAEVVSAHTDGLVARATTPTIRFVKPVLGALPMSIAPEDAISIDPPVVGVARWTDTQELVFSPAVPLAPGTTYTVTVHLDKLGFAAEQPPFQFQFSTLAQSYELEDRGLEMDESGKTSFRGRVRTSDAADNAAVEKMLTAKQGDQALTVTWTHEPGNSHEYVVSGITRQKARSTLTLSWDGGPIEVDTDQTSEVTVPSKSEFGLLSYRAEAGDQQYIELRFTDPLSKKQDLSGLIRSESGESLRFEVDRNVVKVYSASPWVGGVTLQIEGVKNSAGAKLPSATTAVVSFEPIKPEVRFASKGVILPTTQGLVVPIEAVNVRAVEIEATRVFESNVPQFLQVNDLDGDRELTRVGKVVYRQRVPIAIGSGDQNRWVRVGLDVSRLVQDHPTGLYHLEVRFDRPDIVYDCPTAAPEPRPVAPVGSEPPWDRPGREGSFWDFWGDGDGEDWYERYQQRNNPCSMSYYAEYDDHDISVGKNILVSNVGVIAKRGEGDGLTVVVNDIRTTAPSSGATVRVLDYQLQTMATGSTGTDGVASLVVPGHPFAIEATVGSEHGYVKLDRGGALATSHFDTGGGSVEKGVKGALYAERGVWRPGDDIYLTFVLQDETGKLPKDHPVQFELKNPLGQLVERRTVRGSIDGFYDLKTRTAADAPTGPYTAIVDVGGRKFQETLRVEAIQPNRLKIAFDLPKDGIKSPDLRLRTALSSRWLHGAPAPNLRAQIDAKLLTRATTFSSFADYTFDDPTRSWSSETFTLFEGSTDSDGNAKIDVPVEVADGAPGMLTLQLSTRLFEPSGAFSIDQTETVVSPHERYVGIKLPKGDVARDMLLTDTKHTVDVVTVAPDGKAVGGSPVRWALYKINWRWWWEKGDETLADYSGNTEHAPITSGVTDIANGRGSFQFEVKYPDWGRYLLVVTDEDGTHRAGKTMYIDWPGWAGRAAKDNPGGASVLSVTADKTEVEVGQPVVLTFPTPKGMGRALLSLETGSKVLRTAWVEPAGESTSVTVVATPDMAPSVYANVTLLQPHESTKNDLPIRLYGIVPIKVVDKNTKLTPVVSTAEEWRPEGKVKIDISESSGRAMTYTLAIVDEGLLGLTRFKTPDPWSGFYGREALGVRTWDIYDSVAGAYGAALEGQISIGGDGEGAAPGPQQEAKRFPPMVIHLGTHRLAAGEKKTHEVDLPPYIGEVRVMAIAGRDSAYGSAEKSVKVKKPLMVLASIPRVLGPGEDLTMPVDVFALDPKIKDVNVEVQVEGPLTLGTDAKQRMTFTSVGDQLIEFPIHVQDALGVAKITVTAKGGGESASHSTEIAVRHPGQPQTVVTSAVVEPGKTWNASIALPGIPGTNELSLEVSRVPPLNMGKRLQDLIHYPHGCVEQTTSGAFPQMMLSAVVDLTPEQKAEIQKNVSGGIERLKQFQTSEGGFAYWPGSRDSDPWATSYAGHFLIEAERAGYLLPGGFKRAWIGYQTAAAGRWTRQGDLDDLQQSYRLYTLALAGQPDLASMNRLKDMKLSTAARFRLASAYQLAGHPEVAKRLAEGAIDVGSYRELSGTYGSDLRDRALVLETLVLLKDSRALPVAKAVSESLSSDKWLSTQETAMALLAMARFAEGSGSADKLAFTWGASGDKKTASSDKSMTLLPVLTGDRTEIPMMLQNTSSGPLFLRAIARGLPKVGEEQAQSNGLSVDVTYTTAAGTQVDPANVGHGTDLIANVVVTNTTDRKLPELALTQGVPSGWELFGNAPGKGDGYDHRDVRDDRVYTYFDLAPGQALTFTIKANAGYRGRYYLPPVHVEAMYDATLAASSTGQWVVVSNPAEG